MNTIDKNYFNPFLSFIQERCRLPSRLLVVVILQITSLCVDLWMRGALNIRKGIVEQLKS
jgi:hypothetical protein